MTGSATFNPAPSARRAAGGFTLVELLVVVVILLILVTLLVGVGARVLSNQRVVATKGVLGALDRALEEYIAVRGSIPPYAPESYEGSPGMFVVSPFPDASPPGESVETGPEDYEGGEHVRRPHTGLFLAQTEGFGEVDSIIQGLDADFIFQSVLVEEGADGTTQTRRATVLADAWADPLWSYVSPGGAPQYDVYPASGDGVPDWDMAGPNGQQLIYYVHPSNRLAQDLFGRCEAGRPYFMSAGPDRRYGLGGGMEQAAQESGESPEDYRERVLESLEDNIYSYAPGDVETDEQFFQNWRDQEK